MDSKQNSIKLETFAGNPRKSEWASVYAYTPEAPAIFKSKGEIFAVLSLAGPNTFDASQTGNFLLDELHESYFEAETTDNIKALQSAINNVKKRLIEFLKHDDDSSLEGIEFSLSVLVVKDTTAFFANFGESKILGFRKGEIAEITTVLKDPERKKQIKVGSMYMEKGDRLLLLSQEADFELKEKEKEDIFTKNSLNTIRGRYLSNEALVAAILVSYKDDLIQDIQEKVSEVYEEEESLEPDQDIDQDVDQVDNVEDLTIDDFVSDENEKNAEEIIPKGFERKVLLSEGDKYEKDLIEKKSKSIQKTEKVIDSTKNLKIENIQQKLKDLRNSENAKTIHVLISNILNSLLDLVIKIKDFIFINLLNIGNKKMYARKDKMTDMNWRPLIFVIVVISIVGFFSYKTIKEKKEQKAYELAQEVILNDIESQFEKLESQVDTLYRIKEREDDKNKLLADLSNLKTKIQEVELFEERKGVLDKKIDEYKDKLVHKVTVNASSILKDIASYEEVIISDISVDTEKDNIYISDSKKGVVYRMNYQGENIEKILEGLKNPRTLTISELNQLVIIDDEIDRSMKLINLDTLEIDKPVGLTKDQLAGIADIDAYRVSDGDDRIYGIKPQEKILVQMRKGQTTYGLPSIRLSSDNFQSNILDVIVFDGNIYLLTQDQGLVRYYGDSQQTIDYSSFIGDAKWQGATAMTIDEKYVYLVNNTEKKVIVLSKTRFASQGILDYILQYDLSSIMETDIVDVFSDISSDSLFVATQTKVIKLNLQEVKNFSY